MYAVDLKNYLLFEELLEEIVLEFAVGVPRAGSDAPAAFTFYFQ